MGARRVQRRSLAGGGRRGARRAGVRRAVRRLRLRARPPVGTAGATAPRPADRLPAGGGGVGDRAGRAGPRPRPLRRVAAARARRGRQLGDRRSRAPRAVARRRRRPSPARLRRRGRRRRGPVSGVADGLLDRGGPERRRGARRGQRAARQGGASDRGSPRAADRPHPAGVALEVPDLLLPGRGVRAVGPERRRGLPAGGGGPAGDGFVRLLPVRAPCPARPALGGAGRDGGGRPRPAAAAHRQPPFLQRAVGAVRASVHPHGGSAPSCERRAALRWRCSPCSGRSAPSPTR